MDNNKSNDGTGESFVKHQQAIDQAINERTKDEQDESGIDPERANDNSNKDHASDTPTKKTGGGKQKNKGM